MEINITLLSGDTDADPQEFQVEVSGDDTTKTTHRVTVSNVQHQRLTGGLRSAEELVKASFEFLLERELVKDAINSGLGKDNTIKDETYRTYLKAIGKTRSNLTHGVRTGYYINQNKIVGKERNQREINTISICLSC